MAPKPDNVTISLGTRPADGRTFIVGEYSFTTSKDVIWTFLDNRFCSVFTTFTIKGFLPVHDALSKTFGPPNLVRSDDILTYYYWTGTLGRVMHEKVDEIDVGYASYEFILNRNGGPK